MSGSSKKVTYAALAGNTLISVTKFIAAGLTGSSAMFSEGIHSLVDTGNQVLLLHGRRQARKPADAHFPFGYGKEIYFWSFVVAILIFAVGAGVSLYEGVIHIMHPVPINNPLVNYIVLALLFEGAAWYFALNEFSRTKGKWGYIEAVQRGKGPNEILTMHMGPDFVLVNLSLDFDDSLPAGKLESLIAALDNKIKQTQPTVKRVFVEAEARRTSVAPS